MLLLILVEEIASTKRPVLSFTLFLEWFSLFLNNYTTPQFWFTLMRKYRLVTMLELFGPRSAIQYFGWPMWLGLRLFLPMVAFIAHVAHGVLFTETKQMIAKTSLHHSSRHPSTKKSHTKHD